MNQKEIKRLARPYARLIRWSDEDQCFIGSLPELDGDCTHGNTVEEVARNLDECAELYVEDCLTDGAPLPEPRAAVIVPGKSRAWANENAIAQGIKYIFEFLERKKQKSVFSAIIDTPFDH